MKHLDLLSDRSRTLRSPPRVGLTGARAALQVVEVDMQRSQSRSPRGMALLEIMVVITLIALVTAAIAVNVFSVSESARPDLARTQANELAKTLEIYRLKHGSLPSTGEGLTKLTDPPPLIARLPADPWGKPYVYVNPGEKNAYGFDVVSMGPDGVINTHDDVGNF